VAEVSEKLSDVIELAIKYGGGEPLVQRTLAASSTLSQLPDDVAKRADVATATARLSQIELELEQTRQILISAARDAE
jgi:hypothetical protein